MNIGGLSMKRLLRNRAERERTMRIIIRIIGCLMVVAGLVWHAWPLLVAFLKYRTGDWIALLLIFTGLVTVILSNKEDERMW
jgi:hypothetical protein